ncbi:alpha/beta hydrolase [Kribbella monticola]|uniref:alpha/beta hydrolase n=1 Tax=Kribbella monticola TaxID=2185285 RepID=UPI000DD37D41|nr:alpha/beta fold hydrolase [Kribbella monticola]
MSSQLHVGAETEARAEPERGKTVRRTLGAAVLMAGAGTTYLVAREGVSPSQLACSVTVLMLTLVSYLLVDRGTCRQRASAAFAVGLVAMPVGVGIGVPHLVKTGVRFTTFVGLLVLLGGLVSICGGGALLVRRTPGWQWALVVPALLATALVALSSLGQAVAATNVPRTDLGDLTPADYGLPFSEVGFTTADGVPLAGWYLPSANRAAVVLRHGAGSTRSDVLAHAVVLAGHGYGVLLVDARGHGRSGGRAMDFGWYGDQDITAAVSYLQSRKDADDERIGAVGLSMGGEEAIGAAAADDRIRAVVAEGATSRVAGDKAWLSDHFGWRGRLQEGLERLTYGATDLLTAARPPVELRAAVASSRSPVLLIAGGKARDEAEAAAYIQAGSPATVRVWIAPRAAHSAALADNPADWTQHVTEFLAGALHPRRAT